MRVVVLLAAFLVGGCGSSDDGSSLVIEMYDFFAPDEVMAVIDADDIESFEIVESASQGPSRLLESVEPGDRIGKLRICDPESTYGSRMPAPISKFRIVVDGVEVWGTIWEPRTASGVPSGPVLQTGELLIGVSQTTEFDESVLYLYGNGVAIDGVDLVEAALQAWTG